MPRGPGLPKSGTNAAVETTGAALAASEYCKSILIQADPDNSADVFFGDSVAQDIQLAAGGNATLAVGDPASIFVKSASGTQRINYLMEI